MTISDETLKKIDALRQRGNLSYRQASELLEEAGGDLIQALILLEEKHPTWQERFQVQGGELVQRIKELIREGNISRIIVKQNQQTLLEIPVTVGALGAVFLPTIAAVGVVAALVTRCTIVVERREPHDRKQETSSADTSTSKEDGEAVLGDDGEETFEPEERSTGPVGE